MHTHHTPPNPSPSPPGRRQIKPILATRSNRSAMSSGRSALHHAPLLLSQLLVTFHLRCSGFSGDVNWITLIRDLIKAWRPGRSPGRWQLWLTSGMHGRGYTGAPEAMGWLFCRGRKFVALELWEEQANTSKLKDGFRWFRLQLSVFFFPEMGLDNHSIEL